MSSATAPLLDDDLLALQAPGPDRRRHALSGTKSPSGLPVHARRGTGSLSGTRIARSRPALGYRARQPRLLPLNREAFAPGTLNTAESENDRPAPLSPTDLTRELARDLPGVFTLHAQGDQLSDAMVAEGDLVLVQQVRSVAQGELAAVYVGGRHQMVLRRVYYEGNCVRLQPENRAVPALILDRNAVHVRGRVLAIVRQQPA